MKMKPQTILANNLQKLATTRKVSKGGILVSTLIRIIVGESHECQIFNIVIHNILKPSFNNI